MAIMKNQTLRLPEDIKAEITKTAKGIGEKEQTTIRLALKKGLPLLLKDFSSKNHLASNKGEKIK